MAVAEQVPVAVIIASGDTTVFPYSFLVQTADDMDASIDGVELAVGYYTITGLGQLSGGTVIFGSAPVQGARVLLERRTKLTRSTVFDNIGDFQASVLNSDLDRPMLALQELKAKSDRIVTLAAGDPPVELTAVASSEGKVLGVQGGVLGFIPVPAGDGTALAALASPAANQGSALVTYKAPSFGSLSRPIFDRLSDEYLATDFLSANQRSDMRDGVGTLDMTAAFTQLMNAMPATGGKAYFDQGAYLLSSAFTATNKPLAIIGAGIDATRIMQGGAGAHAINFVCNLSGNNIAGGGISHGVSLTVKDLAIHRRTTSGGSAIKAVWNAGTNDRPYLIIENVVIDSDDSQTTAFAKGLDITNTNGSRITNLTIHGNRLGFDNTQVEPYAMTKGLHFQGDNTAGKIDHFLSRIVIGNANQAVQTDSWHEGMYVDGFELTYVTDAFVLNGYAGSGNPDLFLQRGHMNVRRAAIVASNIKNVWMTDVDCYKDGGAPGAGFTSQMISLDTCDDFQFNGGKVENVQSAATDGIAVTGTAERGRVRGVGFRGCNGTALAINTGNRWSVGGNNFTSNGVGVFMAGTGCRIDSSNVFAGNTTNVVDNGTNYVEKRTAALTLTVNLTGGATSEVVNFAIPAGVFDVKPSAVIVEEQDSVEDILGYYSFTTGSTATNARVLLKRRDGAGINSGPHRFSVVAYE